MKVKIKKLRNNGVIPKYAKSGDAGLDLTAVDCKVEAGIITYKTGLAIEIPEGYVGLLFPRSSIYKKNLSLVNSVGVIDSGYRGEIVAKFKIDGSELYKIGERFCQLIIMPYPRIEFKEVDNLNQTDRGDGGFGSSGN